MIAVIDIGSNTIKLLVARCCPEFAPVHESIEECRISAGISMDRPILSKESMLRGVQAVVNLLEIAGRYEVETTRIVATSAVRDAENGREFAQMILDKTNHPVKILDGDAESRSIAEGLKYDPEIDQSSSYHHFDLGGGSLEFNCVTNGELTFATSLKLGAVRLTERFFKDARFKIPAASVETMREHVLHTLANSVQCNLGDIDLVATGGSAAIAKALINNVALGQIDVSAPNTVTQMALCTLLEDLASDHLEGRLQRFPNLPRNRGDVICGALVVMIAVMDFCKKPCFTHSKHSLRHGIAVQNTEKYRNL